MYGTGAIVTCKNPTARTPELDRAVLSIPVGVMTATVPPSECLSPLVEHFWWVQWDVDEPRSSEVLSYPSVHVVFEGAEANIVGVVRQKFVRRLDGVGEVFGIKFRPGMFRQLSRTPAHRLTNQTLPLCREAWGGAFTFRVLGCGSVDERIAIAEAALREICPVSIWDPRAILARDLVERVRTKPDLRSVSILAEVSDLSERALQRLFRDYVGVSPKWVVRRFRLQEAAELLATTQQSVASVAADLGYFDQSHFVRDFKAAVGEAPLNFLRKARNQRQE